MTAPDLDRYVQSFQRLDGAGSAAINALRERGLASFTSLGALPPAKTTVGTTP